jgi:hypothetical protein
MTSSSSGSLLGHADGQASTVTRLWSRFRFEDGKHDSYKTRLALNPGVTPIVDVSAPISTLVVSAPWDGQTQDGTSLALLNQTGLEYIRLPVPAGP